MNLLNIKPIQGLEEIYQSKFFSPVRTGVDFVAKNLTGLPLVGTIASGIGSMFQPMSPQDRFNQQNFSLGANPGLANTYGDNRVGNLGGQDPYGINTVSAFGNYDQYALNKAFQLQDKLMTKGLTPFQQQKMEFYEDVIKKSGFLVEGVDMKDVIYKVHRDFLFDKMGLKHLTYAHDAIKDEKSFEEYFGESIG